MKKTVLLLICCAYISKIAAQSPPDSMLVSAYNQALQRYWEKFHTYWEKFKNHPTDGKRKLYSDFLKPEFLSPENREHFTIVSERELYARCNRLFVSRKSETVYHIKHSNFQNSIDTIDILVTERSFKCLRRNHISIGVSCRGDMGYIPEGRLILDKNKKWVSISYDTLYAEALERAKLLHKPIDKKQ